MRIKRYDPIDEVLRRNREMLRQMEAALFAPNTDPCLFGEAAPTTQADVIEWALRGVNRGLALTNPPRQPAAVQSPHRQPVARPWRER